MNWMTAVVLIGVFAFVIFEVIALANDIRNINKKKKEKQSCEQENKEINEAENNNENETH